LHNNMHCYNDWLTIIVGQANVRQCDQVTVSRHVCM
jgi:hypothetical protein